MSETYKFLQGLLVGIVIITPISGGTFLLILGLYEDLMRDISNFKLLRWLTFLVGTLFGVVLNGLIFTKLIETYTIFIVGFLFGCLLASIRDILDGEYKPGFRRLLFLLAGLGIGLFLAGINELTITGVTSPGLLNTLLAGSLSSLAMILPGVPGGSVLILMGMYYPMMRAIANLDFITLSIFLVGGILGILGLANILNKLYGKYQDTVSWFFVGLVLGSSKILLAFVVESPLIYFGMAVLGFITIWTWSNNS
ncbi:MAG: undecaprenyl phosphate translocase family protein [Bacillota bacterium]